MLALDIALKDIRLSFRSRVAIIFMFVIPILVTTLFALMFGGIAGDEDGFALPQTKIVIANLDKGSSASSDVTGAFSTNGNGAGAIGEQLVQLLIQEDLADMLSTSVVEGAAEARARVDSQAAAAAVIIPETFSDALFGAADPAQIELYTDPTLTLGPAIVESIVRRIIDGFASGNIAVQVAITQLATAGVTITPDLVQELLVKYTSDAGSLPPGVGMLQLRPPPQAANQSSELASMLSMILSGMMIFFAFFTGANSLNSVLEEEEQGTLQRMFTTPASLTTIISGKLLAALITLSIQVTVLLGFGRLVFDIRWGQLLPLLLAAAGVVLIASATGLFLVSFMRDPRQAGIMFGGLLTLTGMIGLIRVFTAGSPGTPPLLDTISLIVPQGWAVRALNQATEGQPLSSLGLTLAGILAWSTIFFVIGNRRLQRRFA